MNNEVIKELWEVFSKEEERLGDNFLVGIGSSSRLDKNYSPLKSYSEQIMSKDEDNISMRNDLSRFEVEKVDILNDEMYEKLFVQGKKKAYDVFDYFDIKSKLVGDALCKKEDLILDEDDRQLMNSLKSLNKDYFAIQNLATIYAYIEMGISEVRFKQLDECSMCKSFDKMIFNSSKVVDLLCSGNGVTHRYCDCGFIPVIHRRNSYGILDTKLNADVKLGSVELINVPVEMRDEIIDQANGLSNKIIEFLDIGEYLINNNIKDSSGIVVFEDSEGILFVHNDYVGIFGPVDFLKAFLGSEILSNKIDLKDLKDRETLYYMGKKVVEMNGGYWDQETGNKIEGV